MSFGSTKNVPLPEQKPFNLEETRLDTNEMARPVPYLAGAQRLGLTFISDAFNVSTESVETSVGKKEQVTGYIYYASFAALVCGGPVDALYAIYMDEELVWSGLLERDATDYVDITVVNRGVIRLYWGTETQVADTHLATSPETHSAYRGFCYIVANSLRFGENRTAAPQIELWVARAPKPTWLDEAWTIDNGFGDGPNGLNPMAVFWDLWTNHRFGLGQPESRLDTDTLAATGETLYNENLGVSVLLNRNASMRQCLQQLLEHIDGYPTLDSQGRLGIKLKRDSEDAVPTLDTDDLTKDPEFDPVGWEQTFNETRLTYSSEFRDYKNDAVSYRDRANFQICGALRSQTVARPWLVSSDIAQIVCNAIGRAAALPKFAGRIVARASAVSSLEPGDVLVLNYPSVGIDNLRCRIVSKTSSPTSAEVEMQIEQDLSFLNAPLFTPDAPADPQDTTTSGAALAYETYVEAPFAMIDSRFDQEAIWITWLAVRGDRRTVGFHTHKQLGSGSYNYEAFFNRFAARAHFVAAYSANTMVIDETGFELIYDSPDNTFPEEISETQALENEVLLFTAAGEIMSGFGAVMLGTGHYRVSVVRGRYDTVRQAHSINEAIFVAQIRTVQNVAFSTVAVNWKLQPRIFNLDRDLSLCTAIPVTPISRAYRPLAPLNVRVFEDGAFPIYISGQDIVGQYDSPAAERDMLSAVDSAVYPARETHLQIEIRTVADVLQGTFTQAAAGNTFTITNAELVTALGSETDFILRVYLVRNGYTSLYYDQVTVRKF